MGVCSFQEIIERIHALGEYGELRGFVSLKATQHGERYTSGLVYDGERTGRLYHPTSTVGHKTNGDSRVFKTAAECEQALRELLASWHEYFPYAETFYAGTPAARCPLPVCRLPVTEIHAGMFWGPVVGIRVYVKLDDNQEFPDKRTRANQGFTFELEAELTNEGVQALKNGIKTAARKST